MSRLRYNNSLGTLGASLTSSGTTITFASAPGFATLAGSDFIPLVLEPPAGSPNANFEIVYLTAYTASATTGTILRGQEGTSGAAHSNGVAWSCNPVTNDFSTRICTQVSDVQPSTQVGELIVVQGTIRANTLVAGSTIKAFFVGQWLGSSGNVLRVRLGTAGTTADAALFSVTTASGVNFVCEPWVIVRTTGSGGTTISGGLSILGTAISTIVNTATVAVNTTVANILSLTIVSSTSSFPYDLEMSGAFLF